MSGVGVKVLAYSALVVVQVCVGVVYKVSQQDGSYHFNPSSALTIAECIKLAMAVTLFVAGVHSSLRGRSGSGGGSSAAGGSTQYTRVEQPPAYSAVSDAGTYGSGGKDGANDAHAVDGQSGWTQKDDEYAMETRDGKASEKLLHMSALKAALHDADADGGDYGMDVSGAGEGGHKQLHEEAPELVGDAAGPTQYDTLPSSVWQQVCSEMSVPLTLHVLGLALLYCVNNQLTFLLFRLVSAASISLFKSWSTAITAILLYVLFARPIVSLQWCAIVLQIVGLVVVQYEPRMASAALPLSTYALVLLSVLITAVCSVWNEQVVKRYHASLHLQNALLYTFGTALNATAFALVPAWVISGGDSRTAGIPFFDGYTLSAIGVVACNSVLGLVITAVYKYADAVVKTFATASATVALLLIASVAFHVDVNLHTYMGTLVVFIASYVYFAAAPPRPPAAWTAVSSSTTASTASSPPAATTRYACCLLSACCLLLLGAVGLAGLQWQHAQPAALAPLGANSLSAAIDPSAALLSVDAIRRGLPVVINGQGLPLGQPVSAIAVTINGSIPCTVVTIDASQIECALSPASLDTLPEHALLPVTLSANGPDDAAPSELTAVLPVVRRLTHWERHNIALVLQFNQPRWERLPLLLSSYERLFPAVLVTASNPHPYVTLQCAGAEKGRAVYGCMAELIGRYPQYDGLLMLHFDCALRFDRAERLDASKPWLAPSSWAAHSAVNWRWRVEGPILDAALAELHNSTDSDYQRYLANLARYTNDTRFYGVADVYYLPRRMYADWVKLSAVFRRHEVFGEVAFATMTAMLNDDFERQVQTLPGVWSNNNSAIVQAWHEEPDWLYFHQVPLQVAEGREIIRQSVEQAL